MKILVCTNPQKDVRLEITDKVCEILDKYDIEYNRFVLESRDANINSDVSEGCDAVIVLGGDGTIMRVAKKCKEYAIPIMGVNAGHLGFLAQTGVDDLDEALKRLIDKDYSLEKRMMLTGKVIRNGEVIYEGEALNDVCITRGGSLQILNLSTYVNDRYLKAYAADGVIISTPTGSTGYNLSAGGPIVEPDADMILLTPIAAHTLMNRSILFSSKDSVSVVVEEPHDVELKQRIVVSFDGAKYIELMSNDKVVVTKSEGHVRFIQMNNVNFLETLSKKLKEN